MTLYDHPVKRVLIVDEDDIPIPLGTTFVESDTLAYSYDALGNITQIDRYASGVSIEATVYTWATVAGTSRVITEVTYR